MMKFFAQLMNTSKIQACLGECLVEENFLKQTGKSTETASLRKMSSPGNYVEKLVFYTMESPDESKFLIHRH